MGKKVLHVACIDRTIHNFRLDLLNSLKKMGFETHVVCTPTIDKFVENIKQQGHKFHVENISRNVKISNLYRSIKAVKSIMKKENIDFVHTHTPIGGAIGRIAASQLDIAKVFHTTGGWYFHENMPKWKQQIFINTEKWLAKKTDVIFSVNHEDIHTAKKLNLTPRDKIVYSGPAGVDLSVFKEISPDIKQEKSKELGIQKEDLVIGLVARLVWEKGFKEFIDTIFLVKKNMNSNLKIIIAGKGPQENEIKEYSKSKGLENIINFLGYRTDIPELMSLFDLYLFSSYREGVPISVLESMASRLPVVAFDIRGCREAIIHNETGYIIPFKDSKKMSQAVIELLNDKEKRISFGIKGRERIKNNYTKMHHVSHQLTYYKQLL